MQAKAHFIFIISVFSIIAVVLWFFCAGGSAVHDLRVGTAPVRDELTNAQAAQQKEAETIGRASEAARRSAAAIGNSQRTTEEIKRMERDDIAIIAECQSIVETVRARGGKEDPN